MGIHQQRAGKRNQIQLVVGDKGVGLGRFADAEADRGNAPE